MNIRSALGIFLIASGLYPLGAQTFVGFDNFSGPTIDTTKWTLNSDQIGTASLTQIAFPENEPPIPSRLYFSAGSAATDNAAILVWNGTITKTTDWTVGGVFYRPPNLPLNTNSHVEIGLSIWASGEVLPGAKPDDMFSIALDLYRDGTTTVTPGIFTSVREGGADVPAKEVNQPFSLELVKFGVSYNAASQTLSAGYATYNEPEAKWNDFTPIGPAYSTASWDFSGAETPSFQMGILGAANNFAVVPDPTYSVMALGFQTTLGSPVPEPSTYAALLGLGALGFVFLRRRR